MGESQSTSMVCYTIAVIGGIIFSIGPFTPSCRSLQQWMRRAMFLGGTVAILWGVAGAVMILAGTQMSPRIYARLWQVRMLSQGAALGILVLFLSDPECLRICRKSLKRSRPPSSNAPSV